MSPVRLLTFLKDHRKDLPVALHRKAFVLCTDREIREGCLITPWGSDDSCATNKFYAEGREAWLPYLLINRVDWEAYIAKAEPGFFQPEAVRHVALSRPIIFEDILKAWLGEDNALTLLRKYKYNIANDVIDLVRDMENFLLDAAKDSDIAVYGRCMRKGKELFYPLNPYLPLPVYQENKGIAEHFIFRLYHNCADDIVSEPIYFNADEVIQHFPFLKFAENSAMRQHAKNTKNTDKQAESPLPEQFSQNNLVADTQEPLLSQEEKAVKRAAWEAAINNEKREINDMDKAPRAACTRIIRLMNYLDVCLKNKTAFSIKAQDVNIYKNLIIAEKSDVPYMLAKYPSLPALPPRSRQIK
ncbi:MAG: hypothetical protein LBJ14_07930 [Desulfarculales bacterium]|nr:hypothetical protein [Desulfarculales bacterium]